MPGCTVRGCSNSSAKGFKVHHFPSDLKRRSVWIKNCEREPTWEPSRYTCICEVHFEDSQFESRRADGLRRLKPSAVPTLFNKQSSCSTRRPLTSPRAPTHVLQQENTSSYDAKTPDLPLDDVCSYDQVLRQSVKNSARGAVTTQPEKTFSTNTISGEVECSSAFGTPFSDHNYSLKGAYLQLQPSVPTECREEIQKNNAMPSVNIEMSQSLSNPLLEQPKFQEKGNLKQVVGSATKHLQKRNNKGANTIQVVSDDGNLSCYICSENVEVTSDVVTEKASKARTYLGKILSEECLFDSQNNKDLGLLCSRCIGLLGYTNRLETEVDVIKKAILSNVRHRNGTSLNPCDSTLDDMGCQDIESKCQLGDKHWTDEFLNKGVQSMSTDFPVSANDVVAEIHQPAEIQHECRLCNFQTPHKSLLIYHLRQHLTSSLRCDYCAAFLTGHNSTNCVELCERQADVGERQRGVSGSNLHDVQDNSIVAHYDDPTGMCENAVFFKSVTSEPWEIIQSCIQPYTDEPTVDGSLDAYPPIGHRTYQQCDSHENVQNNLTFVSAGEVPVALFENNFVTSTYNITFSKNKE